MHMPSTVLRRIAIYRKTPTGTWKDDPIGTQIDDSTGIDRQPYRNTDRETMLLGQE